jgi:L-threonylcarbamoyladenylate synthase
VLDINQQPARILRPGGITVEQLSAVLEKIEVTSAATSPKPSAALPSPGMLDKHYAPRAKLIFFKNPDTAKALESMVAMARQASEQRLRVGIMMLEEDRPRFSDLAVVLFSLGEGNDLAVVAARLYEGMRTLDQAGVDLILVRDVGEKGIGLAIRDRLKRAASQVIP